MRNYRGHFSLLAIPLIASRFWKPFVRGRATCQALPRNVVFLIPAQLQGLVGLGAEEAESSEALASFGAEMLCFSSTENSRYFWNTFLRRMRRPRRLK